MKTKHIISKYFRLVFLLCICIYSNVDYQTYATNPLQKIGEKTLKKGIAKSVSRKALKHESVVFRNESRKALSKMLAKNGVKSFLAYSKMNSSAIMRTERVFAASQKSSIKSFKKTPLSKIRKGKLSLKRNSKLYNFAGVAMSIPSGKKALRVKWNEKEKRYVPDVPIKSGNAQVDKKILSERRKAISPYNQFATSEQLKNYNPAEMEFGKPGSGEVLKRNMFKAMGLDNQKIAEGFGGFQAHHVVPKDMKEAKPARDILEKFGIDINSPENGIFLPSDPNSIYKGVIHNTSHDAFYCKKLNKALKGCKSKEEALKALEKFKHDLYNGKLTLKDGVKTMNRNF